MLCICCTLLGLGLDVIYVSDSDSLLLTNIHGIAGQAHGVVLLMVTGLATSLFVMFNVDRPVDARFL